MNNKIKLACFASLLFSGVISAATPCDGFELKIKNSLAEDILVTTINLNGAELQPGGIQKINSNNEQVFTVNNSAENVAMNGEFVFHTISLPSKSVKIQFDMKNLGLLCEHTDNTPSSDFEVSKTRLPGKVNYTISNK